MKKVNGQFIGKIKVSMDSKYINQKGLDEDIARAQRNRDMFKHELETVIDMCYDRHAKNFKQYETAVDILQETLREQIIKNGEQY